MRFFKATLALGAFVSAGMLMAQQASPNQAPPPDASQAAPAQPDQAQPQPNQAQPAPPMRHAPNPHRQARHLAKALGLSRDQVAQIEPILADRIQKMQTLRNDASVSPRDRRAQMRQIMQDSNSRIEAVLNDQQKQQFEQMQAARREHRRSGATQPPQTSQPPQS